MNRQHNFVRLVIQAIVVAGALISPRVFALSVPVPDQASGINPDAVQNENSGLDVILDLRDGSRLVGTMSHDTVIPLFTDFGTVDLPLSLLAAIEFSEHESVTSARMASHRQSSSLWNSTHVANRWSPHF